MSQIQFLSLMVLTLFVFFTQPCKADPVMIAAGSDTYYHPLISVSNDYGSYWVNSFPATQEGVFHAAKCTVGGSVCIAAGQPYDLDKASIPLLYRSNDKGISWTAVNNPNFPALTAFTGVGCTGEGDTAICFAAGSGFPEGFVGDDAANAVPLLAISTDGGKTWSQPAISQLPAKGAFLTGTCSTSGTNPICVAVGESGFLVVSNDGGKSWSLKKDIPKLLDKISCTGSGSSAVCAAISMANSSILVSKDGGNTWASKTITGQQATTLTDVSCTGEAPTAVCVISGSSTGKLNDSMLAVSHDNGDSWIADTSTDTQFSGSYSAISCTGNGSKAVCVATGGKGDILEPYALAISKDGAQTWFWQSLPYDGKWGYVHSLHAVACQSVNSNVVCMAMGYSSDNHHIIAMTKDINSTPWELIHISNIDDAWFNDVTITSGA